MEVSIHLVGVTSFYSYFLELLFLTTMLPGSCRLGLFDPAIVYDHLGDIFSTLIAGSFLFCVLLYIKVGPPVFFSLYYVFSIPQTLVPYSDTDLISQGHMLPSSADWGSSGNIVVDFFWVRPKSDFFLQSWSGQSSTAAFLKALLSVTGVY